MMKISKSHTRLDPFVSREPDAEEATKANPYQPPWVRKIQESIALVVALLLVVGLYYLFMGIGGKIPGAVRDASIYLDGVQRSAEGRLNDAAQEPHERQAQFQNPASSSATLVHARSLSGAPGRSCAAIIRRSL